MKKFPWELVVPYLILGGGLFDFFSHWKDVPVLHLYIFIMAWGLWSDQMVNIYRSYKKK